MANDVVPITAGIGTNVHALLSTDATYWQANIVSYVTGGSTNAWLTQQVDATHGLPVNLIGGNVAQETGGNIASMNAKITACNTNAVVIASGSITVSNASIAVTGTFYQATQPVSGTVAINASTTGGYTPSSYVSAAGTNLTSVKSGIGILGPGSTAFNTTATTKWLKIFDKLASPTLGTDLPVLNIGIPGNGANGGGNHFLGTAQISLGMWFAITGGSALLDTTAVALGDVAVNLLTK